MKFLITRLALLLLIISSLNEGVAQSDNAFKNYNILVNASIIDTVSSYFPPTYIPQNCTVTQPVSLGGGKYQLTISPNQGFAGTAKVLLQYTEFKPPFSIQPRFLQYNISVVTSIVTANPDFVSFNGGEQTLITPLSNDSSTDGSLTFKGVAQVQYGTVEISNDTLYYTPAETNDLDFIIYSVADTTGATGFGMIYLTRNQSVIPDTTSLTFSISNRQSQVILLPGNGFVLNGNPPVKGVLHSIAPKAFRYTPNSGTSGNDNFVLHNPDSKVVNVSVKIIPISVNSSSVVDDIVFTPVNTAVTFNVFNNDLSSNFPVSNFSSPLQYLGNGVFTYNPPVGFSGQKVFSYTVNYGTYTSTAKITLNVGNFAPQYNSYNFSVLKNHELVLEYNVPINGYSFEILSTPQFGEIEVFNQSTQIESGCNTLTGKAKIIYSPFNNYFGPDEADIRYCINGNQCKIYKLNISVLNQVAEDTCVCVGSDCVWAGDINGDGRVSVSDLLPLGRFLGNTGPERASSGLTSNGDFASNWQKNQNNGKNLKFADADGDGILSENDLIPIDENYNAINNLVSDEVLAIKEYPFQIIPSSTEVDSGDLLTLYIQIGNNNTPVKDISGLAFGLNIDPLFYDSTSLEGYFYTDSWFTAVSPSLQLIKQPVHGSIHAGFTRTGGSPGSGNGIIGQFSIVVDEADGFKTDQDFIEFRISTEGIEMEDEEGDRFKLEDSHLDIQYRLKKSVPQPSEEKLMVYPNPAQQNVNIHFNGRNIIHSVSMTDMLGNVITSDKIIMDNHADFNVSHLPSGIYILKVRTSAGVITKKIQVVNK